MNSFGNIFRITLFGESHSPATGIVIDGIPAGIALKEEDFEQDLGRRRSGAKGTTPRIETDHPEIITGLHNGHTTGSPLVLLFANGNTHPGDYENLKTHPRPSHADRVAAIKYAGFNNPAGGGMFSGRLTVGIVAAGVVAKKILHGVTFTTELCETGGESDPAEAERLLDECRKTGDSVGGRVRITVTGAETGLGEPLFDSAESMIAHIIMSIPGVKGIEFGSGFEAARRRGSENNDPIIDSTGTTATNNDGGINGGITNGNDITISVAFKPTPSIGMIQNTYDMSAGKVSPLKIEGRHDVCIAIRGAVVAEAAAAIALADLKLLNDCRKNHQNN